VKRRRLLALTAIVAWATALALALEAAGELAGVYQFESFTLDWRQTTTAESFVPGVGERESDIVLVLFDEFTVMDAVSGWDWISPFPRTHLAALVDALAGAGARTIGLDVFLDRLYPRLPGDDELHDAMARAGNVILVTPLDQTEGGATVAAPHGRFASVAAGVGTAELPSSYETFRLGALAARSGDELVPSFALALYAHARGLDADSLLRSARASGRIDLPGLPPRYGDVGDRWWARATTQPIRSFPVRFLGPPSSSDAADQAGTFPAYSSGTLADIALFSPESFRDKIVLIGTGFHAEDRFRTPFQGFVPPPDERNPSPEPYEWMYGVEIHANALQNMLDGEYVRPMGAAAKLLLLLLAATATGWTAFRRGAWWGAGALAATIVVVAAVAAWAWAGQVYLLPGAPVFDLGSRFLWIPVTPLLLSGSLSYVGSVAYVSIVEGRDKRYIKGAFGKYLSPEVVDRIAENPELLQLGGEKRVVSLLFSDLAGFTSISESRDAQDVIAILNEYLDDMTQVVKSERGCLDKYIGDAIMAFWNAPEDVPDHADRAIRSAVLMQRRMAELNARWSRADRGHDPMKVRIGVHTGEVVVGNIGGEALFDYTAIGDAVNLAARLEPANKDYETLTMVSATTLGAASRTYRVRELDYIAVVGKEEPVKVYELLEEAGVPLAYARERALERYAAGMAKYKSHDWQGALEHFEAALEADPSDGPSRVYAERCRNHIEDPPPPDWDFVVHRTKK